MSMAATLLSLASPLSAKESQALFENHCTTLELAKAPLSRNAVDITLKQAGSIENTTDQDLSDIWETRQIAERHLEDFGYKNRLCYSKLKVDSLTTWQLVSYSSPPWFLDNFLFRKIYSVWQQASVLFRTAFPSAHLLESEALKARLFWKISDQQVAKNEERKTGTGALSNADVIQKQIVYPITSDTDDEIFILYNYAPLQTKGEQLHFLLLPNPKKPAKNFLELDREQYIKVLSLGKKVALWAKKKFGHHLTIHFFDKTGEIAGQTQPLYHAHLIILKEDKENVWAKLAMFFRMLMPPRPLSDSELKHRVTHYKNSLGTFITEQD